MPRPLPVAVSLLLVLAIACSGSDDVDSAAQTLKMPAMRSEDDLPTDPGMAPITPMPTPTPSPPPRPSPPRHIGGGDTLESTGNRRRRKNG